MCVCSQEVGYPKRIEEVTSPDLLFAVVFAEVDELKDIGMPWFEVYSESARALVATLVDVASGGVKRAKHGHDTIRVTISARNIRPDNRCQHNVP
jgi:hypothetical protein